MNKEVSMFLDYLSYEKHFSNLTVLNYKEDLEKFEKYLDGKSFKDVDVNIIRDYLANLHSKASKKSICRYISTLRSFYRFLYRKKIIENNPMILIENPKVDKTLPKFLYNEELDTLLNTPDLSTNEGIRDKLIIELFYSTGIRVSELSNLKLENINFKEQKILILGKGNKERIVLYGKRCEDLLNLYLTKSRPNLICNDSDYLFVGKKINRLNENRIRLILKKILKISGLEIKLSPHVIRHTFASDLLNNGADLRTVQELLGHENLKTTEVYTHVTNDRLRKIITNCHPRAKK